MAAGKYPDIGGAADSMANINGLNIVKIKYERLDKWLPLANSCSFLSCFATKNTKEECLEIF